MTYDWFAGLVFFGTLTATTAIGRFIAFRIPSVREMRELNDSADQPKLARRSYQEALPKNVRAAKWQALGFYVLILPFCVNLAGLPWWRFIVDVVAVLMLYDLTYYLTHRFLFHGKPLRKIHALHHQARKPTYVDSLYVHPIETLIGQGLFQLSIPAVALATGAPLNVFAMVVATQIFVNAGTLNHVWVDLPRFPFKWLQFLTTGHAAHHVDMNQGNYCQITLLFDWLFGTYEQPVVRSEP
ncbi:sterol desaturase family protein [Myxococcota bacterium]|nr:sterol desaturase family protein [Myxococcota bacterium]